MWGVRTYEAGCGRVWWITPVVLREGVRIIRGCGCGRYLHVVWERW